MCVAATGKPPSVLVREGWTEEEVILMAGARSLLERVYEERALVTARALGAVS